MKVKGLISSAQWGCGFSTSSRQFFYINGRPCNLTKVARAINEVYKSFNTNQLPLAILDFKIPNGELRRKIATSTLTYALRECGYQCEP